MSLSEFEKRGVELITALGEARSGVAAAMAALLEQREKLKAADAAFKEWAGSYGDPIPVREEWEPGMPTPEDKPTRQRRFKERRSNRVTNGSARRWRAAIRGGVETAEYLYMSPGYLAVARYLVVGTMSRVIDKDNTMRPGVWLTDHESRQVCNENRKRRGGAYEQEG